MDHEIVPRHCLSPVDYGTALCQVISVQGNTPRRKEMAVLILHLPCQRFAIHGQIYPRVAKNPGSSLYFPNRVRVYRVNVILHKGAANFGGNRHYHRKKVFY